MNYYLAKTDAEVYSIDDLERDKKTVWDGIKNALALRAVKAMKPGDLVLVYHSVSNPGIVGVMKVNSEARPDLKNEKSWVVDVEFVSRFKEPVTLKEIKESGLFDDWQLVYHSRLSTMTAPEKVITWLRKKGLKV